MNDERQEYYAFEYRNEEGKIFYTRVSGDDRWPDVLEDFVRFLEGIYKYNIKDKIRLEKPVWVNLDDEVDMYKKPVRRAETQRKRPINENVSSEVINIDEKYLRKLIASELTKALPKIIENYFDSRLVKENVQFKAGNTIFSGTVMPMPKVKGKNNI